MFHIIHAAVHQKDSKLAAATLIVMGIFFTPILIGVPLLGLGLYRLCK